MSNNLVLQARDVHAQWLAVKKANRDGRKERVAEEEAARAAPRYELETFDVSCGAVPEAILRRTPPMPEVLRCARELIDTHVFGEARGWMRAVARELEDGAGAEFITNVWWWQMVLDHLQLRSQRVLDATKREAALPAWQRTRSAAELSAFNESVPLSAVYSSNCIEEAGLSLDLEGGGDARGDGDADGDGGGGSETGRNIAQRLLERARRMHQTSSTTTTSAPPSPGGVDAADADMPPEDRPPSPSSFSASAAQSRGPSRGGSQSRGPSRGDGESLKGGLPGLFRRLCTGYRSLFLTIAQSAMHAASQRRSSTDRDGGSPPPPAAPTAATVLELSASSSMRDRACSYFRALVIEAVVVLFHSAYAGSVSLADGALLHFPVLRERVARTVDEMMFGTLAPPGMCVWAPSTCGLDLPPAIPAPPAQSSAPLASAMSDSANEMSSRLLTSAASSQPSLLPPLQRSASMKSLAGRTITAPGDRSSLPRTGKGNAAAAAAVDEEWFRHLRAQLQDLFSTLDAGTRLSLLMPLVPAAAPDPALPDTPAPASPSAPAAAAEAEKRDDGSSAANVAGNATAVTAAAAAATPAPAFSSPKHLRPLATSRTQWDLSSAYTLPCASEIRARRHAIRAAEKAKAELGDPASAAIQHALDLRTAARRKRLPASQDHRTLSEVRRELLRPGHAAATTVDEQLPKVVEKVVQRTFDAQPQRRRGSVSGLGAGPFKSVDAVQLHKAAAAQGRASTQDAGQRKAPQRRGSHTVVNLIDGGARSTGSNKTGAGLADVPIAAATFVYSPLIMSDVGERSGLIGKIARPSTRLAGSPFPFAHHHALSLRLTDPPPSLLTDVSTGAGTLSASPALALLQKRRASVQGGAGVKPTGGLSRSEALQVKWAPQPPSLNLFLLGMLQQVDFDRNAASVRSKAAIAANLRGLPSKAALSRLQSQASLDSYAAALTARRGESSSAASGDDAAATFITGVDPGGTASHSDAAAADDDAPPPAPPPALAIPVEVLKAYRVRAPPKSAALSSATALYAPPAACTPSISLALGSRRITSSLTTLPAAEDPQHALVVRATALSVAEQCELITDYRAKERATREAISASVRASAVELVRLRVKHDALTKSAPDLHKAATELSRDHDRHYQKVRDAAAPAGGIFGRPRRSPVRLPRALGSGFASGGDGERPSGRDKKSTASVDGSDAVSDDERDDDGEQGGVEVGDGGSSEVDGGAFGSVFGSVMGGGGGTDDAPHYALHPGSQVSSQDADNLSQLVFSTALLEGSAAAEAAVAPAASSLAGASSELTPAEVDAVLSAALAEGCDHVVADDGTVLPAPELKFSEPPPVLTLPPAAPDVAAISSSSSSSPRKRGQAAALAAAAGASGPGASSTQFSTHSPHSKASVRSQAPAAPEDDLDPLAKELGMSPEQVARVQFAALRAMHQRMQLARSRGVRVGEAAMGSVATGSFQRAQREAIRNLAAVHIGKGAEQLLSSMLDSTEETAHDDDFKWIRHYEGAAVQQAVHEREMDKRGRQAEAARKAASSKRRDDDGVAAPEDAGALDALAGTLLASSNTANGGYGDGVGLQERTRTEKRLAIISRRRRHETGSTFGHSDGLYSGVPYFRQVSITSGKVVQTGKALGLSHVDLALIRQATEKRRLRELILREHAKSGNASLQKVAAMRKQHGVPGGADAGAAPGPASSASGAVLLLPAAASGVGVAAAAATGATAAVDPGAAPTERRLQGVSVAEVHSRVDSLLQLATAFESAAGDFSVLKVGLGSKLTAKQLYDGSV